MKKLLLTVALMAIMGVGFSQTLESESKKAENQAKSGNVSGAAKTASRTWQNHDVSRSSTPGLREAVERKVNEAQRKSATTGSTSGNSSTSSAGKKTSTPAKKD